MPDTKSGRERKGANKRAQLRRRLYGKEMERLDGEEEEDLPEFGSEDAPVEDVPAEDVPAED